MDIIKYRNIYFSVSGILIFVSIVALVVFGIRLGIDFTGGTLWQLRLTNDQQLTADSIKSFFENELKIENITIYPAENGNFLFRFNNISEEQHQEYLGKLKEKFGETEEISYETIGPAIGGELKTKAVLAVILVLLGISLYVAYAFRKVSYPVKSYKYGIITLVTLFHDVVISAGILSFLSWRYGIDFDTKYVVALLVILGFSVHDTIVVFDRIRENLLVGRGKDLLIVINSSVNQTIARSINTSLTLVLVLLALFLFGPESLKYFVLVIMAGTIIGTYSSIFIASPLLLTAKGK
ncbi:MAG: protein translocase subunit SecF [Patescibacteria group bacterium]